jgi:uroporphyrinogen-III decarboxylase
LFSNPIAACTLQITDTTILYLKERKSGSNAVQIFDSWAECYRQIDYQILLKYINQIVDLAENTKVVF